MKIVIFLAFISFIGCKSRLKHLEECSEVGFKEAKEFLLFKPYFYRIDSDTFYFNNFVKENNHFRLFYIEKDFVRKLHYSEDSLWISREIAGGLWVPFQDSLMFPILPMHVKSNNHFYDTTFLTINQITPRDQNNSLYDGRIEVKLIRIENSDNLRLLKSLINNNKSALSFELKKAPHYLMPDNWD